MSKLLEELLRQGTWPFEADYARTIDGSNQVTFQAWNAKVLGVITLPFSTCIDETVTRAEFDAALKQYPSSTQGEIVQPEPKHALLWHILKVTESSNADKACEKYLELLKESVSYVTLLELLGCEDGDAAVVKVKTLTREHGAYKDARVKLREALGIGQGVDIYAHIEQLRKDRDLLNARNREIVKLNDSLAELVNYVHETFYADTGKLVLMKDVDMRLDQLACHVRGIPSINAAESALTGLLDKMGCKGTGEALEKYRAGQKAAEERDDLLIKLNVLNLDAGLARIDHLQAKDKEFASNCRQLVKIDAGLRDVSKYVVDTFYPNERQPAIAPRNYGERLRVLEMFVRGIPAPQRASVLHGGQLYRNATVLLRTEQLIVWRDADNQEHSAPAHQVTLNPDDNGLAAAILSRIGSYEVAPEHIAEMRQQMGWNDEA